MSREEKFSVPEDPSSPREDIDGDFDLQINLRLRLDEVADVEEVELRRRPKPPPGRRQLCQLAKHIHESRRLRNKMLDRRLFGEPAWDMLLALYFMPAHGQMITVTSLAYVADTAPTTGMRWQKILEESGLIIRGPNIDGDRRRILLRLSDNGRELMEAYLTRLYYPSLPSPPADPENAGQ